MARGGTRFAPARRPVAGALEALRINEGLGEQRRVTVFLLPPLRQVPHGLAEHAAGEIWLRVEQTEARLLHDELEPLGPRARIPADPRFAGLEALGRRAPQDHRHPAAPALGDLPAPVPRHLRQRQVMMRRELLLATRVFVGSRSPHLHSREIEIRG